MDDAMRRRLFAATLLMLLGGCASYAWVKPDATAETTARDEAACRAEARNVAAGYVYGPVAAPGAYPPWQMVPYGNPGPYANPAWQAGAEQRLYDSCMRSRGYELMRTDKKRES